MYPTKPSKDFDRLENLALRLPLIDPASTLVKNLLVQLNKKSKI